MDFLQCCARMLDGNKEKYHRTSNLAQQQNYTDILDVTKNYNLTLANKFRYWLALCSFCSLN